MLNYINKLKTDIDNVRNQLRTEKDNFKVIDLNIELLKLESSFNNALNLVLKNVPDNNLLEFAQGFISLEKLSKAIEEQKVPIEAPEVIESEKVEKKNVYTYLIVF